MASVIQNRRELTAAELVLRTLDGERAAVARARCAHDPDLAQKVDRWADRLFPLSQALPPATPPDAVWREIEDRLPAGPPASRAPRVPARRRLIAWGAAALAASIVLALVFATEVLPPRDEAVAAIGTQLAAESGSLAWAVTLDRQRGLLSLRREGEVVPGVAHDLELWLIALDGSVRSLGVLPESAVAAVRLRPVHLDRLVPGATLAISREPLGGSPGPGPSGPVIASATLSVL